MITGYIYYVSLDISREPTSDRLVITIFLIVWFSYELPSISG